jgi:hypothetical protein
MYGPSDRGSGGLSLMEGAWGCCWGHSFLFVCLSEFGDLPQWLSSFGAIGGKGGYNEEAAGWHGWGPEPDVSSFPLGSPALKSDLGETRVAEHTGRTYDGGSDDSNSQVWWTSNFFSFILPLTKMAICLCGA